jgi:hypothetical protein
VRLFDVELPSEGAYDFVVPEVRADQSKRPCPGCKRSSMGWVWKEGRSLLLRLTGLGDETARRLEFARD